MLVTGTFRIYQTVVALSKITKQCGHPRKENCLNLLGVGQIEQRILFPNSALLPLIDLSISSGIEKLYVVFSSVPVHTRPAFKIAVSLDELVLTSNAIDACAAVLDLGTYPIFLANETTFSRNVAESKKDSFTTMLEL